MPEKNDEKEKFESLLTEDETGVVRGTLDQVKCIARGGMAQIFRARQPSLDRFIAVKRLRDELVANPEMIARFRREARALASVLHQNVAHVYDFVEGERESFIVMEYIDGIDVSTIIEKVGNVPPVIAASILLDLTRGVSVIHAHNLIHRDIKPSNIRVTNRGCVKLMDFGIVMDTENESLTRPGMMVGSPSYLSPEQVLGDALTSRADLFLLGIVFYEMLTGVKPFRDEQGETVFQRIREARYIPVRKLNQAVPQSLARIVDRLLRKDPDKRYAEARDLISELERYLGIYRTSRTSDLILKYLDEEALLSPATDYGPQNVPLAIPTRTPRWVIAAIAGAAVVIGLALGYWVGRSHSAPPPPPADSRLVPLEKTPRRP